MRKTKTAKRREKGLRGTELKRTPLIRSARRQAASEESQTHNDLYPRPASSPSRIHSFFFVRCSSDVRSFANILRREACVRILQSESGDSGAEGARSDRLRIARVCADERPRGGVQNICQTEFALSVSMCEKGRRQNERSTSLSLPLFRRRHLQRKRRRPSVGDQLERKRERERATREKRTRTLVRLSRSLLWET